MPKTRLSLTRQQLFRYRTAVNQLLDGGADLDDVTLGEAGAPWILVEHCQTRSRIRISAIDAIFEIHTRIMALAYRITIDSIDVGVPDWQLYADVLCGAPRSTSLYSLPGGSSYPANEVLNHDLEGYETLRRGCGLEGLLLAQSNPPPGDWRGKDVVVHIRLTSQWHGPHLTQVHLPVELVPGRRLRIPAPCAPALFDEKMRTRPPAVDRGTGDTGVGVREELNRPEISRIRPSDGNVI